MDYDVDIIPTVVDLDPHLIQKETVNIIKTFSRILLEDAPQKKYKTLKISKSALHWGQRKLLMSEIEFLTLYGDLSTLVVYAGAAAGYHIPYLSTLFPKHIFHLYDPNPFAIKETDNIKIFNVKMTDAVAMEYFNKKLPLLFISDIRTASSPEETNNMELKKLLDTKYAINIAEDNDMQLKWTQIMKPLMTMLKFKLPYEAINGKNYTNYPKGDIYLPVWGRPATTETRLIYSNPLNLIKYHHTKYEEQMFYFNNETLLSYYQHNYNKNSQYHPNGIDHCYSCKAELYILENYIKKIYNTITNISIIQSLVKNLSQSISKHLSPDLFTLSERTKMHQESRKLKEDD